MDLTVSVSRFSGAATIFDFGSITAGEDFKLFEGTMLNTGSCFIGRGTDGKFTGSTICNTTLNIKRCQRQIISAFLVFHLVIIIHFPRVMQTIF